MENSTEKRAPSSPRNQVPISLDRPEDTLDFTTYAFVQTYLDTPEWSAAITVTVNEETNRVSSIFNTSVRGINAELPPARDINRFRRLFLAGETGSSAGVNTPKQASVGATLQLADILGCPKPVGLIAEDCFAAPPAAGREPFQKERHDGY